MPENPRRKHSLRELFDKQDYFVVRPIVIPDSIYHFFGYREPVTVLFRQRQGYHVYASTKEFATTPISSILGNVSRVIAGVYRPLMFKSDNIAYMSW